MLCVVHHNYLVFNFRVLGLVLGQLLLHERVIG